MQIKFLKYSPVGATNYFMEEMTGTLINYTGHFISNHYEGAVLKEVARNC